MADWRGAGTTDGSGGSASVKPVPAGGVTGATAGTVMEMRSAGGLVVAVVLPTARWAEAGGAAAGMEIFALESALVFFESEELLRSGSGGNGSGADFSDSLFVLELSGATGATFFGSVTVGSAWWAAR